MAYFVTENEAEVSKGVNVGEGVGVLKRKSCSVRFNGGVSL